MPTKVRGQFIPPMLLLRVDALSQDRGAWCYELKQDGYRAIAFKTGKRLHLRSRNDNDFSLRYPSVLHGLKNLPNETVLDGEVVAFDEQGRPSFNALQNSASSGTPIAYFVFDVLILAGRDVRRESLEVRRELLERRILPKLTDPVRYLGELDA